jgi:hypothetical protein
MGASFLRALSALLFLSAPARAVEALSRLVPDAMSQAVREKAAGKRAPRYYMTVFSYQNDLNAPGRSHTFASFVKVDASGKQHVSTISWLPADFEKTREICVFKGPLFAIPGKNLCKPVIGRNFSLKDTLRYAADQKLKVGMWGPYEIQKTLFEEGQARIADLESGKPLYVADDRAYRKTGEAFNCLHAISDLGSTQIEDGGPLKSEIGIWGFNGTKHVLKHFAARSSSWLKESIDPNRLRTFSYRAPGPVPVVEERPRLGRPSFRH